MQANINKGEMGQDRQARIRKAEENLSAGPFSEEERKRYVELQMSGKPEDRPELEKLQDKLIGEKEE
jgi:hypothetical protein